MSRVLLPRPLGRLLAPAVASLAMLAPPAALAQAQAVAPEPAPELAPELAPVGTYAAAGSGAALWVVGDADSTIYLFGTFHALRPDVAWRTQAVDKAFAEADEYWFEIADLTDMGGAVPIIQAKGLSPERPLSSLLTAEEMASLDEAARSVGTSAAQLEPMRPWLASLTLAVATITRAGYRPEHGGDQVLHAMAEATGRPIRGLETMAQQVGFLADLDEAEQLQNLRTALDQFEKGTELLDQMVTAWSTADLEGLDQLAADDLRRDSPTLYEVLFTRRNQNWAKQVEAILAGSGTQFIAVGAGHLTGPDSLQVQLEKRGILARRIAP